MDCGRKTAFDGLLSGGNLSGCAAYKNKNVIFSCSPASCPRETPQTLVCDSLQVRESIRRGHGFKKGPICLLRERRALKPLVLIMFPAVLLQYKKCGFFIRSLSHFSLLQKYRRKKRWTNKKVFLFLYALSAAQLGERTREKKGRERENK
jgi:hypothetical protein